MCKNFSINFFSLIFSLILILQNNILADDDPSSKDTGIKFNIIVDFGLGYAHNPGVSKFNYDYGNYVFDYVNRSLIASGNNGGFNGSNMDAGFTYNYNAELRILFNSFGFSIGTGYYWTNTQSEAESVYWSDKLRVRSDLTATPVLATIYYKLRLGDKNTNNYSFLLIGGGAGYYFSKIKLHVDLDSAGDDSETYKGNAIGCHLKVEYNWVLGAYFNIFAGMKGRYVEITKYKDHAFTLTQQDGSNVKAGFSGADVYFGIGLMI